MTIRNINGTSDSTCKCGSWLDHWRKFSGQQVPAYCPADKCYEKTEVGAHVQKDDSSDHSWYIYPLCKKCNAKTWQSLTVNDAYRLVSANVSQTCGRGGLI